MQNHGVLGVVTHCTKGHNPCSIVVRNFPKPTMLVLAHRGCHDRAPHNSMEAFVAAAASGADGVETDVRISRDGFPVLVHDRVVAHRTVKSMTKDEIESATGHEVPTLDEALARFPDLYWNVEIKTPDAIVPTLTALDRCVVSRLLVTSFHHEAVAAIARQRNIDCGLLVAERPLSLAGLIDPAGPLPRLRTLVWDFEVLDDDLAADARRRGWRNFAYGLETLEEHEACAAFNLDGIITDHVGLGMKADRR
jgi:glycerophosphoryl diester phosphodiesterase